MVGNNERLTDARPALNAPQCLVWISWALINIQPELFGGMDLGFNGGNGAAE